MAAHRNSYRSSAAPHPSQPQRSRPHAHASHEEPVLPPPFRPSGSAIRRANTTAAPASRNPFARLAAAGDIGSSNNPFSRSHASGGLHRSNAVRQNRPSSHSLSAAASRHAPAAAAALQVGLTRSTTSAAPRSSSPSSWDPERSSFSRDIGSSWGSAVAHGTSQALVPVSHSQTVDARHPPHPHPHSHSHSHSHSNTHLTRTGSGSSSHAAPSQGTTTNNIVMNITNINIGSNNIDPGHGHGHGHSHPDSLAGFSRIEIGRTSSSALHPRRSHRSHRHHSQNHGRVSEVNNDDDDDDDDLGQGEVRRAEDRLRTAEDEFEAQFGYRYPTWRL